MEKFCWNLLFWQIFFKKFGCVFSRSNTILAISQEWLVRLMWNKKEVHWLDTGYNMWPWPLTSLMTLTLDVSRSNFEIALSQELLVWLMWNENEVSLYNTGPIVWPCPLTTPMTLTLTLESEIALSQEWDSRLMGKEKDVTHPFMTMILTSVTMVGWADVPDSEWGDFRRCNNFCLSCQKRLRLTLDIWHKEYMGLGKCTGWPFHDLDSRSQLLHRLAKICLSAW